MLDAISSVQAVPQPMPVTVDGPVNISPVQSDVTVSPEAASPEGGPSLERLAVSRVLLNAESLIASIIGVNIHQVSLSVSVARYGC